MFFTKSSNQVRTTSSDSSSSAVCFLEGSFPSSDIEALYLTLYEESPEELLEKLAEEIAEELPNRPVPAATFGSLIKSMVALDLQTFCVCCTTIS